MVPAKWKKVNYVLFLSSLTTHRIPYRRTYSSYLPIRSSSEGAGSWPFDQSLQDTWLNLRTESFANEPSFSMQNQASFVPQTLELITLAKAIYCLN